MLSANQKPLSDREGTPASSGQGWPRTSTHFHSRGLERQTAGSKPRGFGKSPRYIPLFTSGNLCGKEWDLLLCKELIQPLQDDSRSRHTSDSLHANTYPGPSAGTGPWSSCCSQHSPSASLWVARITSAHLQHQHSRHVRQYPNSSKRLPAFRAAPWAGANTSVSKHGCGLRYKDLPLQEAEGQRKVNVGFVCCCGVGRSLQEHTSFLRVGLTQKHQTFFN